MKIKVQITALCVFGLITMMSAQDNELSFYQKLAQKDAHNEQLSVFFSMEDEKDFWKDQTSYENDLKAHDDRSYHIYMKAKQSAYSEHAQSCGDNCEHSDYYYHRASIYFTYKNELDISNEIIVNSPQIASPRIL